VGEFTCLVKGGMVFGEKNQISGLGLWEEECFFLFVLHTEIIRGIFFSY